MRFVAFDLETTGISPKRDRIIEIGAVRFDDEGTVEAELDLVVNPGMPVPLVIQRLVGLADADLREAPTPEEAVPQLADFCDGAVLIAHGGAFDLAFCTAVLPSAFRDRRAVDTLELARILLPTAPSHSLPVLSEALHLAHRRPHRALSDADATRQLLIHLISVAARLPAGTLATMRRVAAQAPGALHDFLAGMVRGEGSLGAELPAARDRPRSVPLGPPAAKAASLAEAAAAFLGPEGPLAHARDGYEYREAQLQMARAVAQTIDRGGRLLVEAGTGIGKSLGYLVPVALWSASGGGRAVVATHTITLQEQLVESELPSLGAGAGDPDAPSPPAGEGGAASPATTTVALLKGRQQYLSLRRWERLLGTSDVHSRGVDIDAVRFKLKVLVWLSQTVTGDRSELRLMAEDEPFWRLVESDAGDCLGRACANWGTARCYMVAARRAAGRAGIVVTNHALLVSDAAGDGRVLGPYDVLVVDEAHHLEASATRQLGVRLRGADLTAVLDRLPPPADPATRSALDACRTAGQHFFGDVKGYLTEALGRDQPGNGVVGLTPAVHDSSRFDIVRRSARHAVMAMRAAAVALARARGRAALPAELLPQPERADDELASAAAALDELADQVTLVLSEETTNRVAWLELRAEQAELRSAPVDVSGALRERVFDRTGATVLTSATLTVGGSFGFIRERAGIGGGAEELALDSPFDYYAQSLCLLPTDMPPYDDAGYDEALASVIADLAVRLGGRTLALFTGYSGLQRVHRLLDARLEHAGIGVVGQGVDGTRRQVLASFVANPRTLLLGTSSLWEGIDLPGDLLRAVVIAKLPFPVPTDPLVQARAEGLRDPFAQYAVPVAVLRLKQGFGRLIRTRTDRGAVVLCDSRLGTREYAARFFDSLPPAAVERCTISEVGRTADSFVAAATTGMARGG